MNALQIKYFWRIIAKTPFSYNRPRYSLHVFMTYFKHISFVFRACAILLKHFSIAELMS